MNNVSFINEKSELIDEKVTQNQYTQGDVITINEKKYVVTKVSGNVVNLKESSQMLFS